MNVSLQAVLVTLYKKYPTLSIKIECTGDNKDVVFLHAEEGQEGSGSGFYDFDKMTFFGMEIQWLRILEDAFVSKENKSESAEMMSEQQFLNQLSLFDERSYDLDKEDVELVKYKSDKGMYESQTSTSVKNLI